MTNEPQNVVDQPLYSISIADNGVPLPWRKSPWKSWCSKCNAHKGQTGVNLTLTYFRVNGINCYAISKKGDILVETSIGEVKTAKLSSNGTLWWNQIRYKEKEWQNLYLVGVCPTDIYIWQLPREQALKEANGFSHVGQDGLLAIQGSLSKLLRNYKQYLLTHIKSEEITIET
jgi:hypothetical protein